ncbi:receptor-like protein 6 [Ziziphus jujuba]|uniref:Receptor-like protein 6 n=1 Tax=Ziziphus jujuba TaxID=326968 RepID=A0ABM4AI37_ZIZJJ|nr:receptor-like protein 6 [Ziziphus jujuba]
MAKLLCFVSFLLCSQLFITSSLSAASSPAVCPQEQGNALLKFKSAFSIDSWASISCADEGVTNYAKTNSWKEGTDCCKWDGIKCENQTGNVIGLDLSCSWLKGPIHSNSSLFLLKHLQNLNFAHNDLQQSKVLPEYGSLSSLTHLNLSSSNFNGTIPLELSRLSRLVSLDLSSGNSLTLESSVWNKINLTQFRELVLDRLRMPSISTATFANLSTSLTILSLSRCELKGEFPHTIIGLPNLQKFVLSENHELKANFSKSSWSNSLQHVDISFTEISGHLPHSIGNLKSLQHLNIGSSKFSGSIPDSLGNLTGLSYLSLFENDFNGHIPHTLSNLDQLTILALAKNRLSGPIPNMFGRLSKLIGLSLSSNSLIGQIPTSICSMSKLQVLELGNNSLSGGIPQCLVNLTQLSTLDLSYNNLVGPIPTGNQFSSFGNESYVGNPGLCGPPLSKNCSRA